MLGSGMRRSCRQRRLQNSPKNPVVPCDHQRGELPLRRADMIGHPEDGVAEPHDLVDVLDGHDCDIVNALYSAAEYRRLHQCCDLHAVGSSVNADWYWLCQSQDSHLHASSSLYLPVPYCDGASMASGTSGGLNWKITSLTGVWPMLAPRKTVLIGSTNPCPAL
jgi:hypothetical protein